MNRREREKNEMFRDLSRHGYIFEIITETLEIERIMMKYLQIGKVFS